MKHSVAFVGGGPAAVSGVVQLLSMLIDKKKNDVTIYVIEKGSAIGPGLPYSTPEPDHILNIDSDVMSPIPDQPNSFYKWLKVNWPQLNTKLNKLDKIEPVKDKFPPRFLFGLYLNSLAENVKEYAKKLGIDIIFITNDEVINIDEQKQKQNYIITLASSKEVIADQVILCTGHMPSTLYRELKGIENYFHSVWPSSNYVNAIPAKETVVVIGSNLSAIDSVLALVAHGHTGPIIMVSPSGRVPAVLGKIVPYIRTKLTLETLLELTLRENKTISLDMLLELFLEELSLAEGKKVTLESILRRDSSPAKYLEKQIFEAKQGPRAWQCFLFSLYAIVPDLWHKLDDVDKSRFLKEFHGPFIKNLAAFPIENAEKILHLLKSNQLKILGGLKEVKYNAQMGGFIIEYDNREYNQNELYTNARYVINGTGPGYDVGNMNIPLYTNLLKKNLVSLNRFGGIEADFRTFQALNPRGEPSKTLFVVGEMTKGVCFATTDLNQVGRQLKQVVYHISINIFNKEWEFSYTNQMSLFKKSKSKPVTEDYTNISRLDYGYPDCPQMNLSSKL